MKQNNDQKKNPKKTLKGKKEEVEYSEDLEESRAFSEIESDDGFGKKEKEDKDIVPNQIEVKFLNNQGKN